MALQRLTNIRLERSSVSEAVRQHTGSSLWEVLESIKLRSHRFSTYFAPVITSLRRFQTGRPHHTTSCVVTVRRGTSFPYLFRSDVLVNVSIFPVVVCLRYCTKGLSASLGDNTATYWSYEKYWLWKYAVFAMEIRSTLVSEHTTKRLTAVSCCWIYVHRTILGLRFCWYGFWRRSLSFYSTLIWLCFVWVWLGRFTSSNCIRS